MIKKKFSAPTPRACFGSDKISSWEGPLILADLWPTAWSVEFAPSRSLSFPHAFSGNTGGGGRTGSPLKKFWGGGALGKIKFFLIYGFTKGGGASPQTPPLNTETFFVCAGA